jgi:hypothetical protein
MRKPLLRPATHLLKSVNKVRFLTLARQLCCTAQKALAKPEQMHILGIMLQRNKGNSTSQAAFNSSTVRRSRHADR